MLETVIAENTAAIRDLIALIKSGGLPPPTAPAPVTEPDPIPPAAPEADPASKPPFEPADDMTVVVNKPAPIDAAALRAKFAAAARDIKLRALKSVGAARFGDVAESQFPAFLAALEA